MPKKVAVRDILYKHLQGDSNIAIAKALHRSNAYIGKIVSSPLFQVEAEKLKGELDKAFVDKTSTDVAEAGNKVAQQMITELAPLAIKAYKGILKGGDIGLKKGQLQRETAGDILDRIPATRKQGQPLAVQTVQSQILVEKSLHDKAFGNSTVKEGE